MTQNSLQIQQMLLNDKTLKGSTLYEIYNDIVNIDINSPEIIENPKLMFNMLNRADELYLDSNFLFESSSLLNTKRRDIQAFIGDICEICGDKIEKFAYEHLLILDDIVYYPKDNVEEVKHRLLRTNYSKMSINDEERKVVDKEWYKLYTWNLN